MILSKNSSGENNGRNADGLVAVIVVFMTIDDHHHHPVIALIVVADDDDQLAVIEQRKPIIIRSSPSFIIIIKFSSPPIPPPLHKLDCNMCFGGFGTSQIQRMPTNNVAFLSSNHFLSRPSRLPPISLPIYFHGLPRSLAGHWLSSMAIRDQSPPPQSNVNHFGPYGVVQSATA